jgi:hypothetical protein
MFYAMHILHIIIWTACSFIARPRRNTRVLCCHHFDLFCGRITLLVLIQLLQIYSKIILPRKLIKKYLSLSNTYPQTLTITFAYNIKLDLDSTKWWCTQLKSINVTKHIQIAFCYPDARNVQWSACRLKSFEGEPPSPPALDLFFSTPQYYNDNQYIYGLSTIQVNTQLWSSHSTPVASSLCV